MKKFFNLYLSFVLCTVLCFSSIGTAYALESKNTSHNNLFILTRECPDEYIEYATANIHRYIYSIAPNELPDTGIITVGEPFCFGNSDSDIFYFPVLCNNEIFYMLRVFPKSSGGYGGVLGKSFVNELNELAVTTTEYEPLTMMMENDSVIAYVGKNRNQIFEYPKGTVVHGTESQLTSYGLTKDTSQDIIVNVAEYNNQIDFSASVETLKNTAATMSTRDSNVPTSLVLTTSLLETQGDESWCAAYATAMIIRYTNFRKQVSDYTRARDVMNYFYDNPSSDDSISRTQVVTYAKYRSLSPKYVSKTLSNSELINQIVNDKPVYLSMYRTANSTKVYHAVVLRGYNTTYSNWSIWNPWYDYYDYFDMDGSYVPAENSAREYFYEQTIYNW